jgi:hypothetical protein
VAFGWLSWKLKERDANGKMYGWQVINPAVNGCRLFFKRSEVIFGTLPLLILPEGFECLRGVDSD